MYFQIKEVILWPRKTGFPPRRIPFETGMVNIITGASRTGKSAVTPIIDYCLGSHTCSIPVNTIRDACSWFGVLVSTSQGEKLFARREPGIQQGTDDMFVKEGITVEIPDEIPGKTDTAENVRRTLDELAGLTKLDFSSSDIVATGRSGRPSFRDMAAFTFQPQNVVANPDVLFYKADTYDHRQKLRTIFPYVLNAITPAQMAIAHELDGLLRELRRKEKELADAQEVSARWLAEIRTHVSTARELGLIPKDESDNFTKNEMLGLLKDIVARTDHTLKVTASTLDESVAELTALEKEESSISRELTTLRRRLTEMKRLKDSVGQFEHALEVQRDRLKISDWLHPQHTGSEDCPVCGNSLENAGKELNDMVAALRQIEEASGVTREIPVVFDLEMQRVDSDVKIFTDKLEAVQIRSKSLTERSSSAKAEQYQAKKVERFVGSLESSLSFYERLGEDAALATEVAGLRERVKQLQREVSEANVNARKRAALQRVNKYAGKLLEHLDVEDPDAPMELHLDDLSVRVTGNERTNLLSEIGSGSNWLAYHIATILGLQQFFLSLEHSPVPQFVIFDQPSQVYFPKKLAGRKIEDIDPDLLDEDVDAIRKAFTVFDRFVGHFKDRFQIIVLDHAPEVVWGKMPATHLVDEWRNGNKLVPMEWLE